MWSTSSKCFSFVKSKFLSIQPMKSVNRLKTTDVLQVSCRLPSYKSNLSSSVIPTRNLQKNRNLLSKLTQFDGAFDSLVIPEVLKDAEFVSPALSDRLYEVLTYNVQGGKRIRGLTVLHGCQILSEKLDENQLKISLILGWCVELLQAYFLVLDDIMDNSEYRRGRECWYRKVDIGLAAINDALMIYNSIFLLLKKHASSHCSYMKFLELFHEINKLTVWGQSLDMISCPSQKPQFRVFTADHYHNVIMFKTSIYSFWLPVKLAMLHTEGFNQSHFEISKEICLKIGKLFQIQDDYLDLYGKVEETGKIGNDISEGKCTFFAVTTLEKATKDEKKIFEENYGVAKPHAIAGIKNLYEKMKMQDYYVQSESKLITEIEYLISTVDVRSLKQLLETILTEIAKRKR